MLIITNTVRDITELSTARFAVTSDTAKAHTKEQAQQIIIQICRYLRLDPAEFLITDESTGRAYRLRHARPSSFTGA
jgi:hypothetical protein